MHYRVKGALNVIKYRDYILFLRELGLSLVDKGIDNISSRAP